MKTKTLKPSTPIVGAVLLMASFSCHAAIVVWGAAQNTTGPGDIQPGGPVIMALNGAPQLALNVPNDAYDTTVGTINFEGVNFLGQVFATETLNSSLNYSTTGTPVYKTSGNAAYDLLIGNLAVQSGATPGAQIANYQITGLVASTQYYVQIWYTDVRNTFDGRAMTLDDSVTIKSGVRATSGDIGQFAIGVFTADAPTQTIKIDSKGTAGRAQISGILVREVVPEPSSLALLCLGACSLLTRRRP